MKTTKKLLALLVVAVMLAAILPTALAASDPTITAPNNTHTYEIYQIFTGDLSETGILTNVVWGENGSGTKGDSVANNVLEALEAVNDPGKSNTEKLAVIQNYVNLNSTPLKTVGGVGTTRADSVTVPAGYYLIKDLDGALAGKNDAYTKFIVSIVKDTTINPKANVPTMTKKVKDVNDSDNTQNSDWQDSADYDIGDKVPFQLKGVVASNYNDYASYYFAFHDVEEKGLAFDSSTVKVYVDGNEITTDFSVLTGDSVTDGCTFEVVFSDLKAISSVKASSVITVEYESRLTDQAVIGEQGNLNKAYLKFSNNPNQAQNETPETGSTPWDTVIVFTYKTIINKVTANPNYNSSVEGSQQYIPLDGAEFTLEKQVDSKWVAVAGSKNAEGTSFTFSGLDDGTYKLTETVTPSGYNKIDPITFTITASHQIEWDGVNRNGVLTSIAGNKETGEITFIADKAAGSLTAEVLNQAGTTLPETGGIGTTLFYVIGSVLVIGAVVLLVSKKRMNAIE